MRPLVRHIANTLALAQGTSLPYGPGATSAPGVRRPEGAAISGAKHRRQRHRRVPPFGRPCADLARRAVHKSTDTGSPKAPSGGPCGQVARAQSALDQRAPRARSAVFQTGDLFALAVPFGPVTNA